MATRIIKTAEAAMAALIEFGGSDVMAQVERRLYEQVSPGRRYESVIWAGCIRIGSAEAPMAEAHVSLCNTADELVRRLKEGAFADRKARLARAKLGHREKGIEGVRPPKLTRQPVLCLEHQP